MNRISRLETFARAGYLARGVFYILLGYLALTTAKAEGTTGIMRQIESAPLGTILLALVGVGLFGWGVFRLYGAAIDIQGKGSDAKGMAVRAGHTASGLFHFLLAFAALRMALGGESGGGEKASQAAGTAQGLPFGDTLLIFAGIAFLLAAADQAVKAASAKFMRLVDAGAPHWVEYVGRAGYAARAVVFAILGWHVASVGFGGSAGQVGGFAEMLNTLRGTQWLYMAVAIGLLLFGVFSLIMARYRRIRNENVLSRLGGGTAY